MTNNQRGNAFGADDVRICKLIKELGFLPKVIYDVGGSNASWTRTLKPIFPDSKYEMFEPQAFHNEAYKEILVPYLASEPNVSLHTDVVTNQDGAVSLRILGEGGFGSSILGKSDSKTIEVPCRKLDTMIKSGTIPKPDLIKMDIQGAELMALEGGTELALPAATVLALELWFCRGYGKQTPLLGEVNEFLRQHNYYPFDVGDYYRGTNGVLVSQDVWYCRMGTPLSQKIWEYGI
jgi:FkbM family methyltransferase